MKSQTSPTIYTVSALNYVVSTLLNAHLDTLWVSGEISNLTRAASGHWYFTLKDSGAMIAAAMFKGKTQSVGFIPKEGEKVEARGKVTLYEPRGNYQIVIDTLRKAGVGDLKEAYEQLKAKLEKEGLFNASRKKAMPFFVKRIGVITSPDGAAIQDILSTLQRRAPHVEIVIFPTLVQGDGAALQIAQQIAYAENLTAQQSCDVLILARGGGSIEDLWAFNDEMLARTIAHCRIPTISGVGHETDFTICDYVADLRAPTPTAAAELAATPTQDWLDYLQQQGQHVKQRLQQQWQQAQRHLHTYQQHFPKLDKLLQYQRENLQQQQQRLQLGIQHLLQRHSQMLDDYARRLPHPRARLPSYQRELAFRTQQLQLAMQHTLQQQQQRQTLFQIQLENLNPQKNLERGYVLLKTTNTIGKSHYLRSAKNLSAGQKIEVITAQDCAEMTVSDIKIKEKNAESI